MYQAIASAVGGCLLSMGLSAQPNAIDQILSHVEQNNQELRAYQSLMQSQELAYKATNNLPNPLASVYYLPFGTHATGDYTEFQIAQSLEFPTVYAARGKWIDRQVDQLQLEYAKLRQAVLLPAKKYCLELIYLAKRAEIEQLRLQQARQVFDQVQLLFTKEQVGILELNKAKIAWMQDQFAVAQLETERRNALLSLQQLNGGEPVAFEQSSFINALGIIASDSLWQEQLARSPSLRVLAGNEAVALQQIKLEKNKVLPNLTAGFNYQGVTEQSYSGVYGGVSIPLWGSRNNVKAARARYQYQQSYTEAVRTELYTNFQEQYNQYQLMLRKFSEYRSTLAGLNSESLLLQAYQLGELSFLDYYVELQFYRQAYDKLLQMEKELHQRQAELLKHQL